MRRLIVTLFCLLFAATAAGQIIVANGSTNVSVYFKVTQADGTDYTGIAETDLDYFYIEDLEAQQADADCTDLGSATAAHTDGGAYEIGHAIYRVDFPDDCFDGGVGKRVQLGLEYAANKTLVLECLLTPPSNAVLVNSATPTSALTLGVLASGTVTTYTSTTSITLDAGAAGTDDLYRGQNIDFLTGTGAGQSATIIDYTAGRICTLAPALTNILESGVTTYRITSGPGYNIAALPNFDNFCYEEDGAEAGVSLSTTTTIYLTATALDAQWTPGNRIGFFDAAGMMQEAVIGSYNSTTDVITLTKAAGAAPLNLTPVYMISGPVGVGGYTSVPPPSEFAIHTGTAQAGGNLTIQLEATASATNSIYNNNLVTILSGTGAGQTRAIASYVGATTTATVTSAWTTNPAAGSVYAILPAGVNWLDATLITALGYAAERGFWSTVYATEDVADTSTADTIYITHTAGTYASVDGDFAPGMLIAVLGVTGYTRPVYGIIDTYDATNDIIRLKQPLPAAPTDAAIIYPISSSMFNVWSAMVTMFGRD